MKRRIKHHQALVWEYLGSIGGSADPGLSENNLRQNPGLYLPGMNIAILWGSPPLKKNIFYAPNTKPQRLHGSVFGCLAAMHSSILASRSSATNASKRQRIPKRQICGFCWMNIKSYPKYTYGFHQPPKH